MSTDGRLGYIEIGGAPHDIGVLLGRFGQAIVHSRLTGSHAWASVMSYRDDPRTAVMQRMVETRFPQYWAELQGLASGLDLPFDDVFLWNCRGDLWAMAPDGCTTVQIPGKEPLIAHNEDGDPGFRGHCALACVRPAKGMAFTSFVYPASIPGHTFATNEAGLVQTVNNIRSRGVGAGLPRMILGRAVLDCRSIDEAVRLIQASQRAGAFHMTFAQRGDPRMLSVEFTHANCSVAELRQSQCHSNHLTHSGMLHERQIITNSSLSRQQRGDDLIFRKGSAPRDPLAILRDRSSAALPIFRTQPDDPDHENTLATAVFEVGAKAVRWQVYDSAVDGPCRKMDGLRSVGT